MYRIPRCGLLMWFFISMITVGLTSCVTSSKMNIKDYQGKSQDEKEIVALFVNGLKAWHACDKEGFLSIYSKDLMILTDGKKDWEEEWFTYDQYASFVESKMKRYSENDVTAEQFAPRKLVIEGDKAHIEIEYYLYTPGYKYQERGIIYADLKKTKAGWRIYKRWFEYICASYNPNRNLPPCY